MKGNDRELDVPDALSLTEHARVGVALATLGRYVTLAYRRALEPTGLAARHVALLRRLARGTAPQGTLGSELGIDAVKMVGLLNDLEREGLATRRRDAGDRRRHDVAITPLGEARLAGLEHAVSVVENELLAGLDTLQRSYLATTLERIAENIRAVKSPTKMRR